jgi:hypothetical protein
MSFDLFGSPANWVTSTSTAIAPYSTAPIKGTRAPHDHLEVRCDHTNRLLGWLSGINARKVPADEPLVFMADTGDLVIEDEDGVHTQGLATEVRVAGFEATFSRYLDVSEITNTLHQTVPEYANRTVLPDKKTCRYDWAAAVVEPHEHEELFDFDNFIPYGVENKELVDAEARFHRLARPAGLGPSPLLKPATTAPAVSTLGLATKASQDLTKALTGAKVPVSELGKTLNQLGAAAMKAGTEMNRVIEQQLGKAIQGR